MLKTTCFFLVVIPFLLCLSICKLSSLYVQHQVTCQVYLLTSVSEDFFSSNYIARSIWFLKYLSASCTFVNRSIWCKYSRVVHAWTQIKSLLIWTCVHLLFLVVKHPSPFLSPLLFTFLFFTFSFHFIMCVTFSLPQWKWIVMGRESDVARMLSKK